MTIVCFTNKVHRQKLVSTFTFYLPIAIWLPKVPTTNTAKSTIINAMQISCDPETNRISENNSTDLNID